MQTLFPIESDLVPTEQKPSPTSSAKAFSRFLPDIAAMLRKVRRWTNYDEIPENERETVETHSLETVWLAAAMLAIERETGIHQLNEYRIMLAAATHDLGEGRMGDIAYIVKNDPRIRGTLRNMEQEFVGQIYAEFPPIVRTAFLDAYHVEDERDKTIDGTFFNAIERMGYVYFAISQVKKGRMTFIHVLERHHAALLAYSQTFESVRALYEPHRRFIEDELLKHCQRQITEDCDH